MTLSICVGLDKNDTVNLCMVGQEWHCQFVYGGTGMTLSICVWWDRNDFIN